MVLSKREKMILFGAVAAVVLLVGWKFVFEPVSAGMNETHQRKVSLENDVETMNKLLERKADIKARWQERLDHGLGNDPSVIESAMWHELSQWSSDSNFDLPNITPQRILSDTAFQEIIFNVSGKGTIEGAARLIWAIEQSKMPVRISGVQLGSADATGRVITLSMRLSVMYLDAAKSKAS